MFPYSSDVSPCCHWSRDTNIYPTFYPLSISNGYNGLNFTLHYDIYKDIIMHFHIRSEKIGFDINFLLCNLGRCY